MKGAEKHINLWLRRDFLFLQKKGKSFRSHMFPMFLYLFLLSSSKRPTCKKMTKAFMLNADVRHIYILRSYKFDPWEQHFKMFASCKRFPAASALVLLTCALQTWNGNETYFVFVFCTNTIKPTVFHTFPICFETLFFAALGLVCDRSRGSWAFQAFLLRLFWLLGRAGLAL